MIIRKPFRLHNVPAHFQISMDVVLDKLIHCSLAYIDGIIIPWEDLFVYLDSVLGVLLWGDCPPMKI